LVTFSNRMIGVLAGSFHGAKPDCGAAVLKRRSAGAVPAAVPLIADDTVMEGLWSC
jgi:hypothetical protein